MFQLPTRYSFQDTARTRFSNSMSLRQGQRSNQGQTMTLHTYTPNQCPYQVRTSYTLRLPYFSRRPPAHPDTIGGNNTPTVGLKDCGVKTWNSLFCEIN